ncbi:FeoA family protein [Petrotoga sibirica]|uniref:Ferrous iron transport protein A n=1 Tax=Petrotoga sibirica TaxID=156202 RepID=A0A4R8EXJ4_9BACT|nr:FeoA domain-containing protein [Petrotoga sibirica]KUK82311.1 MAG: FeoA family protein [Petrotoga mobilis]TDX17422.1 ferrous iron transport protein A [Petrotoga sibirica]
MLIPLHNLFIGQKGKIVSLNNEEESTKNRLLAMGITPGKSIELAHVSPFGDPLVFKIGEKKVVLRKSEASKIFVDVPYKIFNLLESEIGKYEIIDIKGGRNFIEEMRSMGLYKGVNINLVNKLGNRIIIEVDGKKYELGRGRAAKIFCKKVE